MIWVGGILFVFGVLWFLFHSPQEKDDDNDEDDIYPMW